MKKKKYSREYLKKEGEELQDYLNFRRRGSKVESKKRYNRQKMKKGEWKMKTVAQLIEKLKEMPMDAPVFITYTICDEDGEEYTIEEEPNPYIGVFGKVWL